MQNTRIVTVGLALGLLTMSSHLYASETKGAGEPTAAAKVQGEVLETQDAGRYTYVRVATMDGEIWAAAPQFTVAAGDRVTVPLNMPMKDFPSRELKRTFDMVYFAGRIPVEASGSAVETLLPPGHPPVDGVVGAEEAVYDYSAITKPEGGRTVAEVYAQKADLAGQPVRLRGKAVKVNTGIMDRNWIHLRDGTGTQDDNDLLLTTQGSAKPGDTILVSGTLATNRNFGAGYNYAVVLEGAVVTVE